MKTIKCPKCAKINLHSTIALQKATTTLIAYDGHFDIEGNRHFHNPNQTLGYYQCSNGHSFSLKGEISSCWCGWKNK